MGQMYFVWDCMCEYYYLEVKYKNIEGSNKEEIQQLEEKIAETRIKALQTL